MLLFRSRVGKQDCGSEVIKLEVVKGAQEWLVRLSLYTMVKL